MTKQTINIGTSVNKGDGDPLRTAFTKINENFTELYNSTGGLDLSNITESIIPSVNNTLDLGSPTRQWRHVYTAGGSIYLDDIKLTNVGGKFVATKVINPGEENEAEDPEDSDASSEIGGAANLGNLKIESSTIGTQGQTGNSWGNYNLYLDPGGESNAYISIPSVAQQESGAALQIYNKGDASSTVQVFGQGGVQVVTNTGVTEKIFEFTDNGTLNVPYPSQDSFRIRLGSENFVSRQGKATLTLTGDAWDFYGAFVSSQNGERQLAADNGPLPSLTNPGYEDGDTFEIDSTVHGIPGYVLTVALSDVVQAGPAGWTANLAFSPPPDYPSTVNSQGAIKVTSNNNSWVFGTDGELTLPAGGDIVDSTGTSVLGVGSGNQLVSTEDNNTFTITEDGDVVFSGETGGRNRGLVWDYGVEAGGVDSMVRQDQNGLTVRAYTEVGEGVYSAPVNIVTNQDADEKYWTFDGNGNLTIPGDIQNSNDFNISINREDSSTYTWNFGNTGDLTLPQGGDILDSNGNSVLGLPTVTVPEEVGSVYKGLQVSYGMVHSNSSNTELNVNKIVIHKPAQTTTTIHPTSSRDDFEVTGLSTSDVVAMFVFYGDANGPKSLTTLQTFAEAVIDNVILDGGVEGEYQTVDQMKAAFYASGQQLQSAAGGLVANFEFWATDFSISNGYLSSGATTVLEGSGAVFDIADNGDGTYYASGIQNSGTNYLAGHKIKVLGTALGGVTPDNDCIVTVDSVIDGGAIFQWSVAGTAAGTVYTLYGSVTGTNYQVGSGAVVDSLFRAGNTGLLSGVNFSSGGTGYVAGDVLTLPGTAMTSGVRPDNDITITVTGVDGSGTISTWNYGGTLPLSFPVNNINDGGEDQYDTANYINFGSAIEIPYNNGNTVTDSAITGGPGTAYSMVYDNSIFGVLVTGSITSIGTSGNSGADGSSITEAGNIYGPSTAAQTFDNAITHINLVGDPYAGAIVSFTRPDGQDNTIDILIADSGVGALEDIYLEQEQIWIEVRNNDAADIAPATRPWDGMPSYQAYDVLVATFPIDPAPLTGDLVPRANNAKNAYLTWQEALADFGPARGVAIARDSNGNGIFNPYREDDWNSNDSPDGTLWNIDGWADLSDVESRTYDNLYAAFGNGGLGNKIVGAECVMYLPDNGKYYAVKFDSWTQGGNGGGFAYTRRELDLDNLQQGIRFTDGTRLTSAAGIGRVKLESPGSRRIEEVVGYKSVNVIETGLFNSSTSASRASDNTNMIWINANSSSIDNVILDRNNNPDKYTNNSIQFSLDNTSWYTYAYNSVTTEGDERGYEIDTAVTYAQGDTIYFRYSIEPVSAVWWDKNELPGGGTYFRGAVIDYHAYTTDGTIVGTIHIVDDDGEENVTHTEVASGGSSVEWDDLWFVQNEGTISYRRIDGAGRTLKVQWTAKVFYGSEIYD